MSKLLSIIAFLCVSLSNVQAQGIEFVEVTWQDALAMAKEQNKILFVDAYAQWCGPCKKMAKYEFTQAAVGDYYNENFINLKLDMETPNGRTFDSEYPVSAYPTMFFLDGNGKIVRKIKGGQKAAQLIGLAKSVVSSFDFSGKYKEQYEEGDRSYETVYNYVKALNQSKKSSLAVSNEYIKSDPDITAEQRIQFLVEAATEADSKLFEELLANKSEAIALVGADNYSKNVKRACDNTVSKAVEYEMPELLDEAIAKAEQALPAGADLYALQAKKTYASEMRDLPMYTTAVQALAKQYLAADQKNLVSLLKEIMKSDISSTKLDKVAMQYAKKYHSKEKSANSAMLYAEALVKNDETKKAIKMLEKVSSNLTEEDKSGKQIDNLIKILKSKNT